MQPFRRPPLVRAGSRPAFTITELLIAATISLILTYAVVQMFDYVASEARYGRASIELAGQLRSASRRIQTDLASVTAPVRPFADRHGQGYFEYLEGPGSDGVAMVYNPTATPPYTPTWRTSAIDASLPIVAVETSLGGDIDDILMFTAYNPDEPFRGRFKILVPGTPPTEETTIVESKYAEIAMWTVRDPSNGRVNLYRRALLIRPDLTALARYIPATPINPTSTNVADHASLKNSIQNFYQENDISVRYEYDHPPATAAGRLVGNTLADLSRRENRFAHRHINDLSLAGSPYLAPIDAQDLQKQNPAALPAAPGWLLDNNPSAALYFQGNDVLLGEVLAFDVKAYDPLATVRLDPDGFALNPSDPGYMATTSVAGPGPTGAFVDLGYDVTHGYTFASTAATWFSGNPQTQSRLLNVPFSGSTLTPDSTRYAYRTYCTWSQFYEMNARAGDFDNDGTVTALEGDRNGNGQVDWVEGNEDDGRIVRSATGRWVADAGMNGMDDDNDGVADNLNEWDTRPPYPRALRGIQITIRVMEPNSRQVRQMTVVQNFTGE